MHKIINIEKGVTRMPEWRMDEPVDFELLDGEHIAIVGNNASGKSMLVEMITGRHPLLSEKSISYDFAPYEKKYVSDNIRYIRFCDCYGGDTERGYYLQQRWNQTEISDSATTVKMKLEKAISRIENFDSAAQKRQKDIFELFHINDLWNKPMLMLSSGELRKVSLAEAVIGAPRVLIIDNPYIGLDAQAREMLTSALEVLSQSGIIQIVLVVCSMSDVPSFITHIVPVENKIVGKKVPKEDYLKANATTIKFQLSDDKKQSILSQPCDDTKNAANCIVGMNNVTIRYGEKLILDRVNWTIRNGEHWALTGQNGSGKSTLLSIICADNPQSYACDVTLFDIKRGSGESIWDIKKHIGYVSPEMHRALHYDVPAINIVATGLSNTFGVKVQPSGEKRTKCLYWMNILGIESLAERSFLKLSSGEQRLILLARAFVNDPDLLILDEPLHGLDDQNKTMAKSVIDTFCARKNKTMIFVTHYKEEFPSCIDHEMHITKPQTK